MAIADRLAGDGGGVRTIQRLIPWAVLAFVVGGSISWIRRPGDFAGYVLIGDLVLSGQDIYRESPPGLNTWPPFFSLLCVPLALLARPTPYLARAAWLALNFALLWTALKKLVRLVYHTELRLRPATDSLSLAAPEVLLPVLLCYRYILGNFDHLQVNIVIFACVTAALSWHVRAK
ncbi:MAG: glycosyltransferase family 87 protein, partial [Gaiellaceae bacterium]